MDTVRRVKTGITRPVQMYHLDGIQSIDRDELRSSGVYAKHDG